MVCEKRIRGEKIMDLNDVLVLRDMISLGGGQIIGRKKMQKIVYIAQKFSNPFNVPLAYKWNYYGVYSDELTSKLRIGQFFKIFEEIPVMDYGYQSYAIRVKDNTEKTHAINNNVLKELMQHLNSKEPRLLEVISSIIYFKNEGLTEEEIDLRLREFKGHLEKFFAPAYDDLKKIKKMTMKGA